MFLTLKTTHTPALDLGYLLHKNPAKLHTSNLSFGKAHVFYPEIGYDRCVACLLLEIDTLGLRGQRNTSDDHPLAHYVNDRAYAASSFLCVAISKVFGTALGGRSKERQALADSEIPLEAEIAALPSRGGPDWMKRLFEPLEYEVLVEASKLDVKFPCWGESPYYNLKLRGKKRLQDLLQHIYVLVPVLDRDKHYYIGPDEVEKLLRHGETWLAGHPEKEFITSRYLKSIRSLKKSALERLGDPDGACPLERPTILNNLRIEAVVAALTEGTPKRVVDLGCGEGNLIRRLLDERGITEILGFDVSHRFLDEVTERFKDLPEMQRQRISLLHGSLTYRDSRLSGFDAAALVEVVEHLDQSRLQTLERVVFQYARPKRVVLTTPNREFNVRFFTLPHGRLRHHDHRFEWTRAEFEAWAKRVADTFMYRVEFRSVGPVDPVVGAPTQMGVFTL